MTFLNQARDDSQRHTVTKVFFELKGTTDIHCGIAHMNLNLRMDFIMLTMLVFYPREKYLTFVYNCA